MAAAAVAFDRRARWPDIPPELLGLVLARLPSRADRVRVPAVCLQWLSGARMVQPLLPRLLPWAALPNGTFLSLPDGAVHRIHAAMPGDNDVAHRISTGGGKGLLFLVHHDGRCSLKHPLSGDTTPQWIDPEFLTWSWPRRFVPDNIRKAIVSDDIVAVRTIDDVAVYPRGGRAAGAPGSTMLMRWSAPPDCHNPVADIALSQGKLYIIAAKLMNLPHEFFVMDLVTGDSSRCIRTGVQRYFLDSGCLYRFYLVVSGDRLLMVEQVIERTGVSAQRMAARTWFDVFEAADLSSDGHGRWVKVDTLMGRAIFISESCSESFPAGGGGGAREDCIYFMTENDVGDEILSGVHDMREGTTVAPLETFPTTLCNRRQWPPAWLFPVET